MNDDKESSRATKRAAEPWIGAALLSVVERGERAASVDSRVMFWSLGEEDDDDDEW